MLVRQKCSVRKIKARHYEVEDPNNPDCPLVGPFEDTSDARAKKEANEQARQLNEFYKKNWKTWSKILEDTGFPIIDLENTNG